MRMTILTLSAALVLGPFSAEVSAQGRGRGAVANTNPAAGTGVNAAASPGLSRRPDFATARSEGALRAIGRENTPAATGGIGRSGPTVGAQLNAASAGNASDNDRGAARRARGQEFRGSRGLSLHARARQQMAVRIHDRRSDRAAAAATPDADGQPTLPDGVSLARRSPWERAGISRADWLLAKRLASIDKLRDKALEIGNDRMLDQADQLEAVARRQHEQRTGEYADPAPQDPLPEDPAPQDPTTTPEDGTGSDDGTIPEDDTPTELSGEIVPVSDAGETAPDAPTETSPELTE